MSRRVATCAALGAFCALAVTPAHATVLKRKNLEQLYNDSELVFVGTLTAMVVDLDESGLPWTLYTFSDLDILDGQFKGDKFSLRCPGGTMDGKVAMVHGTPHFELGDRSLIFFDQQEWCQIAGWFQGAYKLVDEPDGDDKMLVDHQGRGIVGVNGKEFSRGERVWTPGRIGPEGLAIPLQTNTAPAPLLKDGKPSPVPPVSVAERPATTPRPARWSTFKQTLKTRFQAIPGKKRSMTPVAAVSQSVIAGPALARKSSRAVLPQGAQP